jgi:hypothetical protein
MMEFNIFFDVEHWLFCVKMSDGVVTSYRSIECCI